LEIIDTMHIGILTLKHRILFAISVLLALAATLGAQTSVTQTAPSPASTSSTAPTTTEPASPPISPANKPTPSSRPSPSTPTPNASAVSTPLIQVVSPKVTYPKEGETHYTLAVLGANFGTDPKAIRLFLNDNLVDVKWEEEATDPDTVYGKLIPNEEIDLKLPWKAYSGLLKLKVRVADKVSKVSDDIVVAKKSKSKAAWLAALVTLALLALPLLLVSRAGNAYQVGDKQYGVLAAFFLDKETDTYSLSKFQFYLWTAVGIFGYIYLALVQSLIQGKAVFPEIPENLPGIILISAATTAIATGITSAKGPKGSGDVHPSLGDFITTGGVVVSERFQFFIWTMLGAVTFLFMTLSADPATLHDLPKIPESFLQIMGISSLGYLGGKLGRKPGPVIDQIEPNPKAAASATNLLTLTISGQKLSQDASLRIDDEEVTRATQATDEQAMLKVADSPKNDQKEFCKKLVFDITKPKAAWIKAGKHKVTLTNDDGKAASWDYELK
jgi:hypothetical protein